MPENKFDLNKALNAAKIYTKIDYGDLYTPNTLDVQQTSKNFEDWRKSQGYKTVQEKMQEAMARMPEDINSEDVYDWYNAYQPDPKKQAEFRYQGAKATGALMTIPMTIFSAGTMGWVPALTTTATGFAGAYGGQKLGEAIDTKYGTNTTPWLALTGGFAGGIGGYKGLVKAGSAGLLKGSGQMYGKQFVKDVIDDVSKTTLKNTFAPIHGSFKLRDAEWYMRVRDGKPPIDDLPEYQEYQRTGNTRLLDKTYNGELVVSPKVGLERRVNTLIDRQKFIREHPVSNYSGPTDAPMTIEDALENAGQFRAKYQHQLDEAIGDIKYDSKLSDGILGHTEGTSLGYMYYGRGPRRKANIRVFHAQGSNDIMDAITDLHELHHATGNSDDGYIYNYLKENGIVDWDNVASYYKDSDRGEIGAHLSELPDYLGFTKESGKRYQTAYGKRTINEEDIKNFMRFNEQRGFRQDHTIWGNIKNMKAFLEFMNKHKFAITAPVLGGTVAKPINSNPQQ